MSDIKVKKLTLEELFASEEATADAASRLRGITERVRRGLVGGNSREPFILPTGSAAYTSFYPNKWGEDAGGVEWGNIELLKRFLRMELFDQFTFRAAVEFEIDNWADDLTNADAYQIAVQIPIEWNKAGSGKTLQFLATKGWRTKISIF